jgi:hypothetical protein
MDQLLTGEIVPEIFRRKYLQTKINSQGKEPSRGKTAIETREGSGPFQN